MALTTIKMKLQEKKKVSETRGDKGFKRVKIMFEVKSELQNQ